MKWSSEFHNAILIIISAGKCSFTATVDKLIPASLNNIIDQYQT